MGHYVILFFAFFQNIFKISQNKKITSTKFWFSYPMEILTFLFERIVSECTYPFDASLRINICSSQYNKFLTLNTNFLKLQKVFEHIWFTPINTLNFFLHTYPQALSTGIYLRCFFVLKRFSTIIFSLKYQNTIEQYCPKDVCHAHIVHLEDHSIDLSISKVTLLKSNSGQPSPLWHVYFEN